MAKSKATSTRNFEGMPVVDTDAQLIVMPNEKDIATATPGDPENCAIAQACKRLYNSAIVEIWKRVAYIEIADQEGNHYVLRFHIAPRTRAQIIHFDQTREFPPGGFVFEEHPPSMRLDAVLARGRARAERLRAGEARKPRKPGEAAIKGEARSDVEPATPATVMRGVRSGVGQVHFAPTPAPKKKKAAA